MTKQFRALSWAGLLAGGIIFSAVVLPTNAAYECPEGFYWSRETIACEQTTCPANSHRSYTLECICDNELDVATYQEIGLLESCSAGLPNTNSVEATPPNSTNATDSGSENLNVNEEPAGIQSTPDEELTNVLPFVPTERQVQFKELVRRYRDTIPRGVFGYGVPGPYEYLFTPGQMNNLTYGANDTACGGYQDQVLKWLLSLYFSKNSTDQALLDGFDFGPIQIAKGAHQAVVIFPTGTDWQSTGIVLDPWPEQTPRLYSIDEWDGMFLLSPAGSTGNIVTPIGNNTGKFPTTPSENGSWEYDDVYTAGSRKPRNRSQGGRRLAVRSPVLVVVTNGEKEVGMYSDGSFVNDFGSNIEGYVTTASDGTYHTDYNLPDGQYGVIMTATGAGEVHVYAGTGDAEAVVFETVTVNEGDQLILGWEEEATQPILFDSNSQEVASTSLTDLEPSVFDSDDNYNSRTFQPTELDWGSLLVVGVVILAMLSVPVTFVIVVLVVVAIRKRRNRS